MNLSFNKTVQHHRPKPNPTLPLLEFAKTGQSGAVKLPTRSADLTSAVLSELWTISNDECHRKVTTPVALDKELNV